LLTITFIISVLMVTLVVVAMAESQAERELNQAHQRRYVSQQLAEELRQSSMIHAPGAHLCDLRQPEYARQYQAILDIRDGKRARPNNTSASTGTWSPPTASRPVRTAA
jgi:methyl-accepting chemotaxis protein